MNNRPSNDPCLGLVLMMIIGYVVVAGWTRYQAVLDCQAKGGELVRRTCVKEAAIVR